MFLIKLTHRVIWFIYNVPLVPTVYNDRLKCHGIMGLIRDNLWCFCVIYNNLYVEGG